VEGVGAVGGVGALGGDFLGGDFLGGDFFAADFFAADFVDGDFFVGDFLAGAFLGWADFFAGGISICICYGMNHNLRPSLRIPNRGNTFFGDRIVKPGLAGGEGNSNFLGMFAPTIMCIWYTKRQNHCLCPFCKPFQPALYLAVPLFQNAFSYC
jgi:hypothetical protein